MHWIIPFWNAKLETSPPKKFCFLHAGNGVHHSINNMDCQVLCKEQRPQIKTLRLSMLYNQNNIFMAICGAVPYFPKMWWDLLKQNYKYCFVNHGCSSNIVPLFNCSNAKLKWNDWQLIFCWTWEFCHLNTSHTMSVMTLSYSSHNECDDTVMQFSTDGSFTHTYSGCFKTTLHIFKLLWNYLYTFLSFSCGW